MIPRTIREATYGKLTLRLLQVDGGYTGIVVGDKTGRSTVGGSDREDVWRRLQAEAGKAAQSYVGFDGARARFLQAYPQGFATPAYIADERAYKLAAKQKLDTTLPLAEAAVGKDLAAAAMKIFQATNLLAPVEKAKLHDALRSPAGDDFVRAAAAFAQGQGASALREMAQILRPFDSAKWTVVTYLPYLWRPVEHAFLKPEVTKEFAARVGHRFARDYQPQLQFSVYESLLDLFACTEAELSDLHPRDRIDTQSFIWVVGAYADEVAIEEIPVEASRKPSL